MSEKKAKKLRKVQEAPVQVKKNKGNMLANVIITVVVLAIIGAGVFAIIKMPKTPSTNTDVTAPSTDSTLGYIATIRGTTPEELLATYGVDASFGFNQDTPINEVANKMTVENYAKFEGVTMDELKANYKFGDEVTSDMTMEEASDYMPVETLTVGMEYTYEQYLEAFGLTVEELPPETLMKDARPILNAAQQKMMEQQVAQDAEAQGVDVSNVSVTTEE
ncbi:MAG: hypothetical protein Q4B31_01760 [Clostridia bacterium]|nr:hypothetical protein [Clostridia bacterium]